MSGVAVRISCARLTGRDADETVDVAAEVARKLRWVGAVSVLLLPCGCVLMWRDGGVRPSERWLAAGEAARFEARQRAFLDERRRALH